MEYVYILVHEFHTVKKKLGGKTHDILTGSNVLLVSKDRQRIIDELENGPEVLLRSPFGYLVTPSVEVHRGEWKHSEYHILERELV